MVSVPGGRLTDSTSASLSSRHVFPIGHSKEEEEDIRRGERGGEEGRARETRGKDLSCVLNTKVKPSAMLLKGAEEDGQLSSLITFILISAMAEIPAPCWKAELVLSLLMAAIHTSMSSSYAVCASGAYDLGPGMQGALYIEE